MTRNEYLRFSLLFQPPAISGIRIAPSIKFINARGRKLSHFILAIMLLLFMSCSSQQIVELTDDCLITKGDIEYIPCAIGERCTVKWNQSTRPGAKYEVRLLYYVLGPNWELLKKGQGAPTTVYSNEYSFDVKPGITIFSVRTVITAKAKSKKSRWAYSNNRRYAADQKPWAIISSPQP
jgi:hypothetical protein